MLLPSLSFSIYEFSSFSWCWWNTSHYLGGCYLYNHRVDEVKYCLWKFFETDHLIECFFFLNACGHVFVWAWVHVYTETYMYRRGMWKSEDDLCSCSLVIMHFVDFEAESSTGLEPPSRLGCLSSKLQGSFCLCVGLWVYSATLCFFWPGL